MSKMSDRVKTINQYYNNLQYGINKKKALKEISTLSNEMKFKNVNDFSDRFLQTISIIEKNISLFKSACGHVDIVATIIDYLYSVSAKLMFDNNSCNEDDVNIIYIISMMCEELFEITSFFKSALINDSRLARRDIYYSILVSNCIIDMILLDDADLYAVISYLKIKSSFVSEIDTIFVHEPIKQKFLWLIEKYFNCLDLPIFVFRSMKELNSPCTIEQLHMVSIWSEDIIAAKNLAMFLNRDITFINAHMEFCTGVLISRKVPSLSMLDGYSNICEESINTIDPKIRTGSIHDFFYDGKLQKPVKDTYWMYNDNVWANATKEDINRCTDSAKQGFQIWSTQSTSSRIEVLSNFAHTLECNGEIALAKIILKCLKLPGIHDNVLVCYQDERLELSDMHTPKGVILLQHKDIFKLFSYLTLSLVVGNSVVVICDENSCTLAQYCNMFATSQIPPGVINILSNKNLFGNDAYINYEMQEAFLLYTSLKQIVHSLK